MEDNSWAQPGFNNLIEAWSTNSEQSKVWWMDAKDVLIFCQMAFKYTDYTAFSERKISPTEIGRRLGLPERTVRLRVKKMEDEGFIKYYQAIPNFNNFGLKLAMYGFECQDIRSKHEAIEKLRKRRGIVEIIDFLGPILAPTFAAESSEALEKEAIHIKDSLGMKMALKLSEMTTSPSSTMPSKLDWKIINSMRYNALLPSSEIARSLSTTRRMVEYRISKLLDSKTFFVKAMIDVKNQRGIVFYTMTLSSEPEMKGKITDDLRALHREKLWTMYVPTNTIFIVNLFAFTAGEPEDSYLKTLKIKGIKSGTLSILREWIEPESPSWIDDLIHQRMTTET